MHEVYVDRRGDKWRIPSVGLPTNFANWLINYIPRFTKRFKMISPDFDLENEEYLDSSLMLIFVIGLIGVIFALVFLLIIIFKYGCKFCGGMVLPRKGYSITRINSVRITMIVFTFFFEGMLIFGYFYNSDFHSSMKKLVNEFTKTGPNVEKNMSTFIQSLPEKTSDEIYNQNIDLFKSDLNFSVKYAVTQSNSMNDMMDNFEWIRMLLILVNLILSSVSCSFGIAAGSINRGCIMIVMVVLNSIACIFMFFSLGIHFTGSKIVYEYCSEIDYYIEGSGSTEKIPMRLQYFTPCVNSPVLPFIEDHYVIEAVHNVDLFNEKLISMNKTYSYSPSFWFNVTETIYADEVTKQNNDDLTKLYKNAVNKSTYLIYLESFEQCTYSRNEIKEENFLFCTYMKDSIDMITLTQFIGCILIIIITITGIDAIKKFEWAGNSNLTNVVIGGKRSKNKPKARRNVK